MILYSRLYNFTTTTKSTIIHYTNIWQWVYVYYVIERHAKQTLNSFGISSDSKSYHGKADEMCIAQYTPSIRYLYLSRWASGEYTAAEKQTDIHIQVSTKYILIVVIPGIYVSLSDMVIYNW